MTILNEYIYWYDNPYIGFSWWSLLGIGLIIAGFGILILYAKFSESSSNSSLVILLVTAAVVSGICITICRNTKIPVTRYEVTITDENFTFEEFNNRYKLIEERGNILVVEEKNDENN